MRKRITVLLFLLAASAAFAKAWGSLGVVRNARYIYVTSFDGDQFSPELLSEDREAISSVQDAIHKSGKFALVYRRSDADVILTVMSRPSEDVLAVYDGHRPGGNYLWRVMRRNGLQRDETPLVKEFLDQMSEIKK